MRTTQKLDAVVRDEVEDISTSFVSRTHALHLQYDLCHPRYSYCSHFPSLRIRRVRIPHLPNEMSEEPVFRVGVV